MKGKIKRRGRKKITFYRKYKKEIKEAVRRFMESESAGAYIGRTLLAMIGLGGILLVGAITPNIFSAFGRYSRARDYNEKQVRSSFFYLRKRGLIKLIKRADNTYEVKISQKGRTKIIEFAVEGLRLRSSDNWDGKWRVVIFDIPEHSADARRALSRKLKALGLFQLQRSVFIYPYPVAAEVQFVSAFFEVEKYIEILTVESMLDDKDLRRHFNI